MCIRDRHHTAPQAAGVQHVCLVHAAQLLAALLGGLKADAADALDLVLGVGHGVDGLLFAVLERIGRIGFETAQKRRKKLCCVDKANVLDTSRL